MPGVKGQRWGERNYQSKDGTWTRLGLERRRAREGGGSSGKKESYFAKRKRIQAEKAAAAKAKKAAAKEEAKAKKEQAETETLEERRARVLKSTNAKELFDNRDILTTAEIRERMDRINVEASLNKMAESQKKTAIDYVDKALMYGKKINEVYEFTQKPVCKALAKKMGLSKAPEPKPVNYEEALRNINRMSNQEIKDLMLRYNNERTLRRAMNDDRTAREQERETARQRQQDANVNYERLLTNLDNVSNSDLARYATNARQRLDDLNARDQNRQAIQDYVDEERRRRQRQNP